MRVLLSRLGHARRPHTTGPDRTGESGAIALVAALVACVLVGISAFVMDFGLAYVSKRQLQTAADAAVLQAASAYADLQGTCDLLLADPDARTESLAVAQQSAATNRPGQSGVLSPPECVDGNLEVTYRSTGDTPSIFGGLFGLGDSITTSREASAAVTVSNELATGFRPMAICSAVLPPLPTADRTFARIDNPGDGHKSPSSCPDAGASGNWWTTDCPGERTGSTSTLTDQILNGCDEGVRVAGSGEDPITLTISLQNACPTAPVDSETCLSGDPGQLDSGSIETAWRSLIDRQEPIVMPAFCVAPQCTDSTLDGTGTNSVFPVYKLVSVVVCGYHFGSNVRYQRPASPGDACYGNPLPPVMGDGTHDNYMQVAFVTQQTSGGTGDTTCQLGTACDGGLRRVMLTR